MTRTQHVVSTPQPIALRYGSSDSPRRGKLPASARQLALTEARTSGKRISEDDERHVHPAPAQATAWAERRSAAGPARPRLSPGLPAGRAEARRRFFWRTASPVAFVGVLAREDGPHAQGVTCRSLPRSPPGGDSVVAKRTEPDVSADVRSEDRAMALYASGPPLTAKRPPRARMSAGKKQRPGSGTSRCPRLPTAIRRGARIRAGA